MGGDVVPDHIWSQALLPIILGADKWCSLLARADRLLASDTKRWKEAVSDYDQAKEWLYAFADHNSDIYYVRLAACWISRGNALQHAGPAYVDSACEAYDNAIHLLSPLVTNNHSIRTDLGAAWSNRGQSLLFHESGTKRKEAIAAFLRAIAIMDHPGPSSKRHQYTLAGAWYNYGITLQSEGSLQCLEEALKCFDRIIPILHAESIMECMLIANTWLNRGNTLQQLKRPSDALLDYQRAKTILLPLTQPECSNTRHVLASLSMNQANAMLSSPCSLDLVITEAEQAISHLSGTEFHHISAAEIYLKARRVQCSAYGKLVLYKNLNTSERSSVTTAFTQGLDVANHWEQHGCHSFRPLARRLYWFGWQFLLRENFRTLPEFIRLVISRSKSSEQGEVDSILIKLTARSISHALDYLQSSHPIILGSKETQNLFATINQLTCLGNECLSRIEDFNLVRGRKGGGLTK